MEHSFDIILVRDFTIALLIGALVGVEREKRKSLKHEIGTGGLRTFILLALTGAVSAWLTQRLATPWIFIAAVLAVAGVVVAGYVREGGGKPQALGLTTEIAAITVCLLGGVALFGFPELAVALGIVTSAVLAFKQPLHGAVERLGTDDIYAGLKLLIATFIILPLLPNRPIDPWQALNPYTLWLLVILISALSLVGYVAMRWLGPARGTALTGVSGGLVSSTAVSLAFARRSRTEKAARAHDALAAGIVLAWAVMFARIVIAVAVVNAPLLARLMIPFLAMGVAALIAGAVLYRRGADSERRAQAEPVEIKNPFSLKAATQFAALFALVLLLVKFAQRYLPEQGVYAVAALAGLTDVDAITLSLAGFARDGGDAGVAVTGIAVAALTNTLVKFGLVVGFGSGVLRRHLLWATLLIITAGVGALALV